MPATSNNRFVEMHALTALEHMRFTTRHRIEGTYTGRHASRQLGGAGEFVDYRDYTPGADLRRLDWKVLARTGKAYVRLFQDETNLLCTLAIDASGSMQFGADSTGSSRSKLQYVQYLACALAHVINRGQDQVGLAILADELAEYIPPGGTASHVTFIQDTIEKLTTRPTVKMAGALRQLFEQSRQRGVLLLMSDFLVDDLDDVFAAVRLFRHRKSEVIVIHVIDPDEERLPAGAAYRFTGMENEGVVHCSPDEIRDLYAERFEAHAAMVRTLALSNGCDYRRVSTAIPYLQTLGGFLVERSG
ncbi:MAG TPA: DUF58 domain-containing protein [Planctomycetaceae bacterium]|jgi:uncharacterized protein (DUF58 family)